MDVSAVYDEKHVNPKKLIRFGFEHDGQDYVYRTVLPDSGFLMTVRVGADGQVRPEVIDLAVEEPYTLHLAEGATGEFVGNVRADYASVLEAIEKNCFDPDVFREAQTQKVIDYIRETYGDEPEYLWPKTPENAVVRRKDNRKWYAAILTVSRRKLGLPSDETAEIIDLRRAPDENLAELVDHVRYFPGWHMNKKNWFTIILDGSVELDEICRRIDVSFESAKKG